MKIETSRFGSIEVADNLIFTFVNPIIGYDNSKQYTLIEHGSNNLFRWLQSIDEPEVAFPVAIPGVFGIIYQFEIEDEYANLIDLTSANDLLTFNIVNIPNSNPKGATINLLGPIIINTLTKKGLQLVLSSTEYQARQKLFTTSSQKAGV